jgi:hypothetical protein
VVLHPQVPELGLHPQVLHRVPELGLHQQVVLRLVVVQAEAHMPDAALYRESRSKRLCTTVKL